MNERERPEPIDGEEEAHEVDDRIANPDMKEPGEEEVLPADAVEGLTEEELAKGSEDETDEE